MGRAVQSKALDTGSGLQHVVKRGLERIEMQRVEEGGSEMREAHAMRETRRDRGKHKETKTKRQHRIVQCRDHPSIMEKMASTLP